MTDRRAFLLTASAALAGLAACGPGAAQSPQALADRGPDPDRVSDGVDWASLTEDQWRERLSEAEFEVLRREGTERPFTSPLNEETRRGTYVCAGCALPLFSSQDKFESGTGWPSFTRPLPGAVDTKRDFKLIIPRTEYHCRRCKGHQGHVFDDGPPPTGQRWCNNGVALDFVPA